MTRHDRDATKVARYIGNAVEGIAASSLSSGRNIAAALICPLGARGWAAGLTRCTRRRAELSAAAGWVSWIPSSSPAPIDYELGTDQWQDGFRQHLGWAGLEVTGARR